MDQAAQLAAARLSAEEPVDEEESSPDTIALEQGRQQRAEIDLLKKQVSARDQRIAYLEQRMRESLVAGWQQTAEEWDKMMQDESHEKSAPCRGCA